MLTVVLSLMATVYVPAAGDPAIGLVPDIDADASLDLPAWPILGLTADENCEVVGGSNTFLSGDDRYRADVFHVDYLAELTEFKWELLCVDGTEELYFSVHERCPGATLWTRITDPDDEPVLIECNPPGDFNSRIYGSQLFNDPYDPNDSPVWLLPGCDYVLGVAWGDRVITYFRDTAAYAKPFSTGQILGRTGSEATELPIPDELTFLPITDVGAYAMEICLAPQPGACCLPTDECQDLTEADCLTRGGQFTAQRFLCAQLEAQNLGCPLEEGGCCLPSPGGSCVDLDLFSCEANGGDWRRGEACSPSLCLPRGACCLAYGACAEMTEGACQAEPGVYQGDDTTCIGIAPACSFGACCVDGICVELTEAGCAERPGTWRGHGSDCDTNPCDFPGACCTPEGCLDGVDGMTADHCATAGGEYRGDWTTCGTLMPDCGLGACCTDLFGGCLDNTTLVDCEDPLIFAGTFRGEGTACATLDPQCRDSGACCFGAGFCGDGWSSAICEARDNNVFLGDLVTCGTCLISRLPCTDDNDCKRCSISLDPCQSALNCPSGETCEVGGNSCTSNCPTLDPVQACCLPNGTCITATVAACGSLYGAAQGAGSTCALLDPGTCDPPPVGACCLPDGQCAELPAADCAGNGGTYEGDGAPCALDLCGACCRDDGTCASASLAGCLAPGDHFYAGRTCAICPPTGACCLPDTTCVIIPQGACEAQDGLYHGNASVCPPDCSRGACCGHNGICVETTTALCTADVGDYVGGTCETADCPAAEACCLPDGSCVRLTVAGCDNLGGRSQGPDTVCTSDTCTHGACCFEDEQAQMTCEVLTQDTCADQDHQGAHQGIGTECTPDTCSFGACCLPDGRCAVLTVDRCAAVSGDHQGAGTECTENTCTHGACCLPEGGCERLTIDMCEDREPLPPGWHRGVDTECATPDICLRGCCCRFDGTWADVFVDECPPEEAVFHPGVLCETVECPAAEGCCLPDESCADLIPARCTELGGLPRGAGTVCADLVCIPGACCYRDGTCAQSMFQDQCVPPAGDFQPQLTCFEAACPPAGACCTPDGGGVESCEELTAEACAEVAGRFYFGDNIRCGENGCPGACCRIAGSCLLIAAEPDCTNFGGVFTADQDCTAIECRGACCLPEGRCSATANWECAEIAGAEFFAGQECHEIICAPKGACCVEDNNGSCLEFKTLQQCQDLGGVYEGDGEPCDPDLCLLGGCCHRDGTCDDNVVASECMLDDDVFSTAGCGGISCPERGACCLDNICEILTETDCANQDGEFGGVGRACDDHACDEGACCLFEGSRCSVLRMAPCERDGGFFDPEHSLCDSACNLSGTPCVTDADCPGDELCLSARCARGACCTADGDCLDHQVEAQCGNEGDDLFLGQNCSSVGQFCEEKRACCIGTACLLKNQADCTDSGGTYWENVTSCTEGLCEVGGCCRTDGTCTDTQTGAQCLNSGGVFQGPGTPCPDNWCHACCLADGTCTDTLEDRCMALTGEYVDTRECADDPCIGACCLANGDCADWTATECTNAGGAFDPGGDCASTTCEAFGACCVNGLCAVEYVSACSGYYAGNGEPCVEGLCTLGACCHGADRTCADFVVASECSGATNVFREGLTCGIIPCDEPRGACCALDFGCQILWESECATAGGDFYAGIACDAEPDPCASAIVSSAPPKNAIDARQPHPLGDDTSGQGWDAIEITFRGLIDVEALAPTDFTVDENGDDGVPPDITAVEVLDENTVRLSLSDPIDPDAWTVFTHTLSETTTCLGYLPGDIGQNGKSEPQDIDALIGCLNADPACELWRSDANRSGTLNAQDVLREIDLLNGAGTFIPWLNRELAPSPCE